MFTDLYCLKLHLMILFCLFVFLIVFVFWTSVVICWFCVQNFSQQQFLHVIHK